MKKKYRNRDTWLDHLILTGLTGRPMKPYKFTPPLFDTTTSRFDCAYRGSEYYEIIHAVGDLVRFDREVNNYLYARISNLDGANWPLITIKLGKTGKGPSMLFPAPWLEVV